MSVFSFGIYPLYWIYRNWIVITQRTNARLSPTWRTILIPFYIYDFLKRLRDAAIAVKLEPALPTLPLALVFAVTQFAWLFSTWGSALYLISFIPLLPANRLLATINQSLNPAYCQDVRFTFWNWLTILGSLSCAGLAVWMWTILEAQLEAQGSSFDQLMNADSGLF